MQVLIAVSIVIISGFILYATKSNNQSTSNNLNPSNFSPSIQTQQSLISSSTPSPSPFSTTTSTHTSTSTSSYATPMANVQVSTSKNSYKNGETIELTIKNNTNQKLTYYGPVCGIFFERNIGGNWQGERVNIFYSESDAQCTPSYFVEAGGEETRKLTIDANPPSGIYRIAFRTADGNRYSSEFTIN